MTFALCIMTGWLYYRSVRLLYFFGALQGVQLIGPVHIHMKEAH